jgi:hypothetical protein
MNSDARYLIRWHRSANYCLEDQTRGAKQCRYQGRHSALQNTSDTALDITSLPSRSSYSISSSHPFSFPVSFEQVRLSPLRLSLNEDFQLGSVVPLLFVLRTWKMAYVSGPTVASGSLPRREKCYRAALLYNWLEVRCCIVIRQIFRYVYRTWPLFPNFLLCPGF